MNTTFIRISLIYDHTPLLAAAVFYGRGIVEYTYFRTHTVIILLQRTPQPEFKLGYIYGIDGTDDMQK